MQKAFERAIFNMLLHNRDSDPKNLAFHALNRTHELSGVGVLVSVNARMRMIEFTQSLLGEY